MALVKIEDLRTGAIFPHENTLPKKREDRLRLMRACRANLSPVFALYPDEKTNVYDILKPAMSAPPEIDFVWTDGTRNRVWAINNWATIESVSNLMEHKPLFIADGHHRYEVAAEFSKEAKGTLGGRADYVMMMLISMNDPGLFILPIHRLVRVPEENPDLSVVDILEEHFYIEPQERVNDYASLKEALEKSPDHTFGLYVGSNKKYYLLSLASDKTPERAFKEEPECIRRLDTRILHGLALGLDLFHAFLGAKAPLPDRPRHHVAQLGVGHPAELAPTGVIVGGNNFVEFAFHTDGHAAADLGSGQHNSLPFLNDSCR